MDQSTIRERWESGDITAHEAIRLLSESYQGLKDQHQATIEAYATFEKAESDIKEVGKAIVFKEGRTQTAAGFQWRLIESRDKVVWNTAELDRLVMLLLQNGQDEIARSIAEARSVLPGTSYVRLDKDTESRSHLPRLSYGKKAHG